MTELNVLFSATIPGRPMVKKNQQRVVGSGKARRVIYSPQYRAWSKDAMLVLAQLRPPNPISQLLEARFTFCFENRSGEADVSNLIEGVQDCLTDAEIILDDKIIRRVIGEKIFGGISGVEIQLLTYAV